ncbi:MAG: VTT domain-containing protein [Anaerolineales bacterium]
MKNPPKKLSTIESFLHSTIALNILRVLVLLLVIGISVYIFMIRDQAAKFAEYGYPGIFLISILANATILLPAPGIAIVFAMGGVFNPLIVGLVAGAGAAIGELSGYLAGFSGQGVAEHTKIYERINGWMQRYGMLTIFVLAAIPNPFFDLAGMSAGALKMPLQKFLIACVLGKIIKMWIFAYAGAYSINWLINIMK